MVDVAGPDVLVLRPAIINLQVTAPDLQTSNITCTFVNSAGQITLYLELWDSTNNMTLARITDPHKDDHFNGLANRVTNKAAMDTILMEWAQNLRKQLAAAREVPQGS